jgi:hypothetical protein
MTKPTEGEVRAAVNAALTELFEVDYHLLSLNCSERSVTHQLAAHLARHFQGYHVDCEYNRDGHFVKKLLLLSGSSPVPPDALDAVTVFPDVIVHVRGNNNSNLLVIEVKKASSTDDQSHDLAKLKAFGCGSFEPRFLGDHAAHLTSSFWGADA